MPRKLKRLEAMDKFIQRIMEAKTYTEAMQIYERAIIQLSLTNKDLDDLQGLIVQRFRS